MKMILLNGAARLSLLLRFFSVVLCASTFTVHAADPFAENIRITEPLTPEEQLKTFQLPPGFQIQLVASEPDLAKPINLAFDAKGRLWVTESREYPYPATNHPPNDSVRVFTNFSTNGHAGKMTIFADGLNIPTGVLPYKNGVIAWSIPNIWYFEDTDGDGLADKRTVLYGPLGWLKDAHGMNSSFRRGYDGWMYATHGFNNDSVLRGRDGNVVTMNSGNTYRVQVDGSRAEHYTWGQVNPFGLCFDSLGNLFSSDCHSQPAYQLLRGGYYPSFGKPHDGLGFAPEMIFHDHGSTAIDGMSMYSDDQWPAEFRENIFSGNVMTSRINRDRLEDHGTTRIALATPDLLVCTDPWFRPVDTQLGPDGALYIADFYNRIIGHYEVPLNHPGRDHTRGRIWRIVYTGDQAMGPKRTRDNDVSKLDAPQLITALRDPNLTYRMLAMNELVDRIGQPALNPLRNILSDKSSAPSQRIHSAWALHRLGGLKEKTWLALANDREFSVRVHAMRIAAELPQLSSTVHARLLRALKDPNPWVQRCAADALGRHPGFENVKPLLALAENAPKEDTHLVYVARQALRDQLKTEGSFTRAAGRTLAETNSRVFADVALAVPTADAAAFLISHVQRFPGSRDKMTAYLSHAARYAPESAMTALAGFVRQHFATEPDTQLALFKSVQQGFEQRGATLTPGLRAWGEELTQVLLQSPESPAQQWHNTPHENGTALTNPWFLQPRRSADGNTDALFLSSLPPGGEALTGILRSPTFPIPANLAFFMAGHDGPPAQRLQHKNFVRLREAESGTVLAESPPPRNDTAQPFSWELTQAAGKRGYVEVVDGDTGSAYAWLAIGRFNPPVVNLPSVDPSRLVQRQQAGAELMQKLRLNAFAPQAATLLVEPGTEPAVRAAVANALVSLTPDPLRTVLAGLLAEPLLGNDLRDRIARSLARNDAGPTNSLLIEAFRALPRRGQLKLSQSLAANATTGDTLLDLVAQGQAPAQLLLERSVADKLAAVLPAAKSARITELSKGLPPANQEIQKLIDARRARFNPTTASAAKGVEIFTRNCRVCHQLEGVGALVGPQLDGIGNRGLERLLEDVLDPNRAVDPSFRTAIITLKDGEVTSGLFRRDEGERIILADSTGKENAIPKNQIVERRESLTSLMPANFGDLIPENDFYDLMAFLISKHVTAK